MSCRWLGPLQCCLGGMAKSSSAEGWPPPLLAITPSGRAPLKTSNGQVWTSHLAPATPAFHDLHCLLSSLCIRLAIQLFTGSQFPYLSLPGSGKVLSLVVLGFIAGSCWAIGLRLGRGFYLWFMLACSELCVLAVAGLTQPHTHSFCACRDMGSGGERGSEGHRCVPLPPAAVCCVGP